MNEISIKEIVAVIVKRKWIIIGFTIACMLASVIFSYFYAKPDYNVKITFSAEPLEMKSGIDSSSTVIYNGNSDVLDTSNRVENKVLGTIINQVKYPKYDINSLTGIINSQDFRDKIYNELKLNKNISFSAVCNSDAKQITLIASSAEQGELVKACKEVFDYFSKYMSLDVAGQLKKNNDMLSKGLDEEKQNITNYKKALDDFKAAEGRIINFEALSEDKQVQYKEIINGYVLANQAFDSYKLVEKEFDIIKQSDIAALLNIRLQSQDSVPFKVSPRTQVNVILGAVFGFMFCFIIILFVEFWPKKLG